jgi:hypothetical protein
MVSLNWKRRFILLPFLNDICTHQDILWHKIEQLYHKPASCPKELHILSRLFQINFKIGQMNTQVLCGPDRTNEHPGSM